MVADPVGNLCIIPGKIRAKKFSHIFIGEDIYEYIRAESNQCEDIQKCKRGLCFILGQTYKHNRACQVETNVRHDNITGLFEVVDQKMYSTFSGLTFFTSLQFSNFAHCLEVEDIG